MKVLLRQEEAREINNKARSHKRGELLAPLCSFLVFVVTGEVWSMAASLAQRREKEEGEEESQEVHHIKGEIFPIFSWMQRRGW